MTGTPPVGPAPTPSLPTIMCARCGHRVEFQRWEFDRAYNLWRIEVRCHGQWDRMEMPVDFLASLSLAESAQITRGTGWAFQCQPEPTGLLP